MSTKPLLRLLTLLVVSPLANANDPAVANLPPDRRPEWLRREGLVMAGSWEQMLFRVRRGRRGDTPPEWEAANGGRDYRPTPQQVAAWNHERSDEMIAQLKQLGVNFIMMPIHKGAGMVAERHDMQDVVEWIERCHRAGMHVGVYADSGTVLWELFFQEKPEARDWLLRGSDGQPILYNRAQPYRYRYNRRHPQAHQYYLDVLRFAIEEAKADLIHMDNYLHPPGTDPCSARLFREYLSKTFTSKELADMGVANLEQVPAVPPAGKGTADSMLRRAWLDFACEFLAESYRLRCEYAHSLRPDILMECNPHGVVARPRPPMDHLRLVRFGEAFWDEARGPDYAGYRKGSLHTRIRSYKVARLLNNMVFCKTGTPLDLAESMAFNFDCLGCICFFEYGIVRRRPYVAESVLPESMPLIRFYNKRRDLFRDGRVIADVAVLRSFPSQVFAEAESALLANRVEQQLIESRVPFQIIGERNLGNLADYRVLALAGCVALSDRQIAQIGQYVADGGRLCIIGPVATHDEWMRPREKPGLADLPAERAVRIEATGNILTAIRRTCGQPFSLETTGAESVGLCAETIRQDRRLLVHLVNYRSDQVFEAVTATVCIPKGQKATAVRLASPQHAEDLALPFKQHGNIVEFQVPRVSLYEIAVVQW